MVVVVLVQRWRRQQSIRYFVLVSGVFGQMIVGWLFEEVRWFAHGFLVGDCVERQI